MVPLRETSLYVHMPVDGTNLTIQEPNQFSRKWNSHKLNGPGLRYEVTVSMGGMDIVSVAGPYYCGKNPVVNIY